MIENNTQNMPLVDISSIIHHNDHSHTGHHGDHSHADQHSDYSHAGHHTHTCDALNPSQQSLFGKSTTLFGHNNIVGGSNAAHANSLFSNHVNSSVHTGLTYDSNHICPHPGDTHVHTDLVNAGTDANPHYVGMVHNPVGSNRILF